MKIFPPSWVNEDYKEFLDSSREVLTPSVTTEGRREGTENRRRKGGEEKRSGGEEEE